MLDLRGEGQPDRPLAPLEQVGEPAVRDDDVRERVRRERESAYVCSSGGAGRLSSSTPIASPRLVTGANRRVPPSVSSISTVWCLSARPCGVRQRYALGCLAPLARVRRRGGVTQPDKRAPAEVDDEKRDVGRTDRVREPPSEYVRGVDRWRVLDRREQLREIQPPRCAISHASTLRHGRRA